MWRAIAILAIVAHFKDAELVVGKTVPEPEQAPIFIQYLDDERFVTNTEFKLYVDAILVCESGDFVETFTLTSRHSTPSTYLIPRDCTNHFTSWTWWS